MSLSATGLHSLSSSQLSDAGERQLQSHLDPDVRELAFTGHGCNCVKYKSFRFVGFFFFSPGTE